MTGEISTDLADWFDTRIEGGIMKNGQGTSDAEISQAKLLRRICSFLKIVAADATNVWERKEAKSLVEAIDAASAATSEEHNAE